MLGNRRAIILTMHASSSSSNCNFGLRRNRNDLEIVEQFVLYESWKGLSSFLQEWILEDGNRRVKVVSLANHTVTSYEQNGSSLHLF